MFNYKKIVFILLSFCLFWGNRNVLSDNSQLKELVLSIEGLEPNEIEQMSRSLESQFSRYQNEQLNPLLLNSVRNIITAGIFEQASFNIIAEVAYKAYIAEMNGAPVENVEDLAAIGFSYKITENQLEMAAKAISNMNNNGVDPLVIEEIISYGIYNDWDGSMIKAISEGLMQGIGKELNSRKLALSLIIGVDQNKNLKTTAEIINESIRFVQNPPEQESVPKDNSNLAFEFEQRAIAQNIPQQVAEELYFIAVSENWSTEAIIAIFNGLIEGQKLGLTTEKLATAFIVRMAHGLGTVEPGTMVQQEMNYIRQLEKKKLKLIKEDHEKHQRDLKPVHQNANSHIITSTEGEKKRDSPMTYYPVTDRKSLNEDLLKQTINQFLGPPATPYRWGGNSLRGVDCSGFTQYVFKVQGIYLPRTSREQSQVGTMLSTNDLQFGDLVFFSKYFNNLITHVGIYVGRGNFVHAACSSGVTLASLNKSYYRARYRGATRVVN